jgi:hypothetical protein
VNQSLPRPAAVAHDCAGCPTRIAEDRIACSHCEQRLPRALRQALKQARRVRYRDHEPFGLALKDARTWWSQHRQETP